MVFADCFESFGFEFFVSKWMCGDSMVVVHSMEILWGTSAELKVAQLKKWLWLEGWKRIESGKNEVKDKMKKK